MTFRRWVKERWKEARWGLGVYLSSLVTLFNLILLISIRFSVYGNQFIWLLLGLTLGLASLAVVIGHLHRKIQQDTDIMLENKALFEEVRKIIREELER